MELEYMERFRENVQTVIAACRQVVDRWSTREDRRKGNMAVDDIPLARGAGILSLLSPTFSVDLGRMQ